MFSEEEKAMWTLENNKGIFDHRTVKHMDWSNSKIKFQFSPENKWSVHIHVP